MDMLSDHIFSDTLRYEAHRLIYTPANDEPVELTGFLGAAMLMALLVNTPEGDARGITLDFMEEKEQLFARYEREVLRDDWGYLSAEVEQLRDSYVQLEIGGTELFSLCSNLRLLDLAMTLVISYMQRLVKQTYEEHIWELVTWCAPFAQWLWDAAHAETQRQRYLHADWTDAAMVADLADRPNEKQQPSWSFEAEQATDIMQRYLEWLSDEYVAIKKEQPGARITAADRNFIFNQETDRDFLKEEISSLPKEDQSAWKRWMTEWTNFLTHSLGPQQEIRFWNADVPEDVQEHLLYRLRLLEKHPAHFRDLTTSIYAMRYLGYIRRKCSDKAMRQWLSEHLTLDYTAKNNASQFQRAMKEHGRYTPEVQDEVAYLESIGYFRFVPPVSPEE